MTPFYAQDHDYSKYNVLAVDDIPLNLLLVQKMLSKFNFQFRTAANGQQALDAVAAQKPDLILLDLMMPGIDGFEVIRRLRENPETADRYPVRSQLQRRCREGFQRGGERLHHEADHHGEAALLRGHAVTARRGEREIISRRICRLHRRQASARVSRY